MVVTEAVDSRSGEELRRLKQIGGRPDGIAVKKSNLMNLAAPLKANVLDGITVK
jgi:hypothetical protein